MADQRVVGVVILALGEERLVGGDERDVPGIGELDQRAFGGALARRAVALQLDVEPVAEQLLQRRAARAGEIGLPGDDRRIERPARPAGERDQAVGRAVEPGELQVRLLVRRRFEEGARGEPHQAAIARLAGGQQHDPRQRPHPCRQAAGRASRRRNRSPARSRRSAGCRSRRAFRRIRAPRTCCRCRSAPAPAGGRPWRTRRACRWSARLRAANRRNARADARSRGRRSRDASVIRFQAMVGTQGCRCPPRSEAVPAFPSVHGSKLGQNAWREPRSPPLWLAAEPPSWHGSRASPASDAIHVRSGMGATDVNTRGRRV